MPATEHAFAYALLRVVPHADRGERLNAGVVLFARTAGFLAVRVALDDAALGALAPGLDRGAVQAHLDALTQVAAGDPAAGAVARLDPSERFGWLTAPSSTVIQPSEVHTGVCAHPSAELDHLLATLVARA